MANLTIILVHGFWGNSRHWQDVIPLLVHNNFNVKAVEIPLTSLADDVDRTTKMINQAQGPVLLVGHSYGGAVITEAGNNDKVVGLVYIAAFAPDKGESIGSITAQNLPEAFSSIEDDSDGYLWLNIERYHESFCQDLKESDTIAMAHAQKAPMASILNDIIEQPAWKNKPCWYQISSQDRMISPINQKNMANRLNAKKIVELNASHAPLMSKADDVAHLIMEAAATFN